MTSTTARRQAVWRWVRRAACAAGLSALVASGGLRQDEIECEEAVAYLQGCCPDFSGATVACRHDSGCGVSVATALSVDESQCILAQSCAQIAAAGLCEKVKNLPSPSTDTWDETSTSHPPVCP
jgi:hypothetical protein